MDDKCCPHRRMALYQRLDAAKNKVTEKTADAVPKPDKDERDGQEAR